MFTKCCTKFSFIVSIIALMLISTLVYAETEAEKDREDELAKQLANPVASLACLPFQFNYDANIGPGDNGERWTLNIQPVLPFELNDKWNLISRTILPVMYQDDVISGTGSQFGLSDTVQSLFFSPRPGPSGLIWAVGPVFLLPTATDSKLGTEKWGAGPTGVVLRQSGPWTYGMLANHIQSFAGEGSRADISSTYFNPFISYRLHGGWTIGTQLEHTLEHDNDQDSGQCSIFASKVTSISGQLVSFSLAPRYWYETSASSPEGFALRLNITLLFPN